MSIVNGQSSSGRPPRVLLLGASVGHMRPRSGAPDTTRTGTARTSPRCSLVHGSTTLTSYSCIAFVANSYFRRSNRANHYGTCDFGHAATALLIRYRMEASWRETRAPEPAGRHGPAEIVPTDQSSSSSPSAPRQCASPQEVVACALAPTRSCNDPFQLTSSPRTSPSCTGSSTSRRHHS
jgi:hypothetical protein